MVTVRHFERSRLAGSKSFRLRSAFRPTYNMAANLLQRLDAEAARALLARSFAQYQADTGVARLEQRLARERDRERDLAATVAELPPLDEARVDSPDAISDAVSRLRPGDLVVDDDGLRLAVLGVSWRKGGRARVRLVNESSREVRWRLEELEAAPHTIGRIDLPFPMAPERIDYRQDVASRIRRSGAGHSARSRRRRSVEMIPGLRWNAPGTRSAARTACSARPGLDRPPLRRSHRRPPHPRPSRRLDRHRIRPHPCGHLSRGGSPRYRSAHGRSLRRPHGARTRVGCFLLHLRTPQPHATARSVVPFTDRHAALPQLEVLSQSINAAERRGGVDETRSPDPGFAPVAHSWAAGESLGVLLGRNDEMTAGDFVRNIKQLTDLLGQLAANATDPATAAAARHAGDAIHRGVVALSGSVQAP